MRVSANTRLLVILGDPVAHSLSPDMHNAACLGLGLDAVYVAWRAPAADLAATLAAFAAMGVAGNVTVPHKEAMERSLTRKTDICARTGACNTFWVEHGTLVGDNTDVPAIAAQVSALGANGGRWLVLGTGGSARAVAIAAADAHAELLVKSRDRGRGRSFVEWAAGRGVRAQVAPEQLSADVVINATPLGLSPQDPLPIAPDAIAGLRVGLDLTYRPGETTWVQQLRAMGVTACDGRDVLVRQGTLAFTRFFPSAEPPIELMRAAVARALRA